jgi:hypothetical protein
MMNLKQQNFVFEKRLRKNFMDREILFSTFFILKETRYSNDLDYLYYKTRNYNQFITKIKNCCISTRNFRSINAKLKLSYIKITSEINSGALTGFYRSL